MRIFTVLKGNIKDYTYAYLPVSFQLLGTSSVDKIDIGCGDVDL